MNNNNNNTDNKEKEPELGAIWERVSANGAKYLSIKVKNKKGEDVNLIAFVNKFKKADNQPDYRIYASKKLDAGQPAQVKQVAQPTPVSNSEANTDF